MQLQSTNQAEKPGSPAWPKRDFTSEFLNSRVGNCLKWGRGRILSSHYTLESRLTHCVLSIGYAVCACHWQRRRSTPSVLTGPGSRARHSKGVAALVNYCSSPGVRVKNTRSLPTLPGTSSWHSAQLGTGTAAFQHYIYSHPCMPSSIRPSARPPARPPLSLRMRAHFLLNVNI
jgi:hypothetical protein